MWGKVAQIETVFSVVENKFIYFVLLYNTHTHTITFFFASLICQFPFISTHHHYGQREADEKSRRTHLMLFIMFNKNLIKDKQKQCNVAI